MLQRKPSIVANNASFQPEPRTEFTTVLKLWRAPFSAGDHLRRDYNDQLCKYNLIVQTETSSTETRCLQQNAI